MNDEDDDDGRQEKSTQNAIVFKIRLCATISVEFQFFSFSCSFLIFIFVSCLRSPIENQIIGCYNGLHLSSSVFILPCNSLTSILHIYYYYYFLFFIRNFNPIKRYHKLAYLWWSLSFVKRYISVSRPKI